MLVVRDYGTKVHYPSYLSKEQLGKKPTLHEKEESTSYRYPDSGPLNIKNYERFLELSKDFFNAHFGKSSRYLVKMKDFEISHELGRGTFGNVVLAKHLSSKINYGIKIIPKEKLVKLRQVEQTLQEKNILQGLNNPFTIYLANFIMDNSYLYLVLPYIEGGELFDYLVKVGKFDETQAQFYLSQVVLGLEYLHHLDLVYRDLKPENILVDHTGYIKFVDFGFSKRLNARRTYTLCGTPEYMAPEIVLNKGHGPPADWWATGVLLYELVSGRTPFQHKEKMRIYEKIVINSFEVSDTFSEDLKDLVENLLQSDPTMRFGNLKGGVNDIKQHRWFKTVNWLAVLNRKIIPTFIPRPELELGSRKKPARDFKVDTEDKFADIFKVFDDQN